MYSIGEIFQPHLSNYLYIVKDKREGTQADVKGTLSTSNSSCKNSDGLYCRYMIEGPKRHKSRFEISAIESCFLNEIYRRLGLFNTL